MPRTTDEAVDTSPPQATGLSDRAERSADLTDAAWLYAWSRQALCPPAEPLAARVTNLG